MDYRLDMSFKEFQSLMMKWLFIGLGITTITSLLVNMLDLTLLLSGFYIITIVFSIIELILVIVLVKKLSDLSYEEAKRYFYLYSIINGITVSCLLSLVSPGISTLALALTCTYFGLLYTITRYTNSDFIKIGTICISVLPILCIAYFILLFFNAPILHYIIMIVDLFIFTGLTLYDMKKAERMYYESPDYALESIALLCAFELYLDFINIFIDILTLIADNQ